MSAFSPGTRIGGRYEVASRPQMGGFGVVYFCVDTKTSQPVVLKTWRPELLSDRAARDAFLREGTHWVELGAHPHIVRCYEVLNTDPDVFLVLELVAKEIGREDASLRSWLSSGPLPAKTALLFALQTARGMVHATTRIPGFVHLDLKPENLLVGADRLSRLGSNRLRITDFGLSRALVRAAPATPVGATPSSRPATHSMRAGGFAGTPEYAAPEQFAGDMLDLRTDVYSLACILVEMLTGRMPVRATSHQERLRQCEQQHRRGLALAAARHLPSRLRPLLERCLAVDPTKRYESWAEVEATLTSAFAAVVGCAAPAPETTATLDREERVAVGWSYSEMGTSYVDLGQAADAIAYFERAVVTGRAEGDRQLEAAGLAHLGVGYVHLGNARRAIGTFEQAVTIAREARDHKNEGAYLNDLGRAYADLGDFRRAIECYEQALAIARRIGDRAGEGSRLGNLGISYADLGDSSRAISCCQQSLAIAREMGDRRGEALRLSNLGQIYTDLGKAQRAVEYHEQELAISLVIGDRSSEGEAHLSLGNAHLTLRDTRRALGHYEQSLAIAREIGDRRVEGIVLGNLGLAYAVLGDARRAVSCDGQALAIAREVGDRRTEANALANLGHAHLSSGDARDARQRWTQALSIYESIGDPYATTVRDWLKDLGSQ